MFFVVPITQREKPKFDAYLTGVLFNGNNELALNLFIFGTSIKGNTDDHYKIKADSNFSEFGKIRDRLVTFVHSSPLLVVSENFKNLFSKKNQDQVQFFPLKIDKVNEKPLNNYYICNITNKYDCTDYEKSELFLEDPNDKKGTSGIYTIYSLVIDPKKIPPEVNIFLLDNIRTPVIIIRQELKQKMENLAIQGFQFIEPKDFEI